LQTSKQQRDVFLDVQAYFAILVYKVLLRRLFPQKFVDPHRGECVGLEKKIVLLALQGAELFSLTRQSNSHATPIDLS
jgi:hypothetical protein